MRKNQGKIVILFVLLAIFFSNFSYAAKKKRDTTQYPEIRTDYLSLGLSSYYLDFSAKNPTAALKGMIFAYQFKAQIKVSYMLLSLLFETGKNDQKLVSKLLGKKQPIYSGSLPTGENINSELDTRYKRLEYIMGFSYSSSSRFHFVLPYTGLGYQTLLLDKQIINPNILAAYRYEWFYIPIGFKLQYQTFKNCIIGLDTSYRFLLGVRSSIYTSKIYDSTDPGLPDIVLKLSRGFSFRTEIPFDFYFNDWLGMTISPWYEHISFNRQNNTVITGGSSHIISAALKEVNTYGANLALNIYLY